MCAYLFLSFFGDTHLTSNVCFTQRAFIGLTFEKKSSKMVFVFFVTFSKTHFDINLKGVTDVRSDKVNFFGLKIKLQFLVRPSQFRESARRCSQIYSFVWLAYSNIWGRKTFGYWNSRRWRWHGCKNFKNILFQNFCRII